MTRKGSDFDIYDHSRLKEGERIQLISKEYEEVDGPSYELSCWLDERMSQDSSFPFFRPYEEDKGYVAKEKWHLSYRQLSENYLKQYSFDFFQEMISQSSLELKEEILINLKDLYQHYILL